MRCSAAACLLRLKGSSAPEAARARAWPEALPNGASAFARSSIFVMPLPRAELTRGAAYDPRTLIDPIPHQIGRAHVCPTVTNAQLVCRLLLEKTHPLRKSQPTTTYQARACRSPTSNQPRFSH